MILTIDIGNTTTNFGAFEGKKLKAQFTMATHATRTPDEVTLQVEALARAHRLTLQKAESIILCSVVPRMSSTLIQALQSVGTNSIQVVGQDLQVPLVNRYTYPEQVGQDRLVGAYAAWKLFQRDCIVADFGTAITIDVVTKSGEYLGGVIAPGLELSLEALASRTALLPKVDLRIPPEVLGKDTANSIRSGILYGCVALCEGLISKLKSKYTHNAVVIATGGTGKLIASLTPAIDEVRPHLVLEGLYELLQTPSTQPVPHRPRKKK